MNSTILFLMPIHLAIAYEIWCIVSRKMWLFHIEASIRNEADLPFTGKMKIWSLLNVLYIGWCAIGIISVKEFPIRFIFAILMLLVARGKREMDIERFVGRAAVKLVLLYIILFLAYS